MTTTVLALSRTTASTWGMTVRNARHIYRAAVAPVMSYGSVI
jgi:hypothetical protein